MNDSGTHVFFREGSKRYVDACRAIREYEILVQEAIKKVFVKSLDALSDAIGVRLSPKGIEPDKWQLLNEGYAGIDAKIAIPEYANFFAEASLSDNPGDSLSAGTCFSLYYKEHHNRIMEVILRTPEIMNTFKSDGDDKEIWARSPVVSTTIVEFSAELEKLVECWVDFWKRVGGIEAVLKS